MAGNHVFYCWSRISFNPTSHLKTYGKYLIDLNIFEKVSIQKEILNFSINYEKNINNYLKRLEKSGHLPTEKYKKAVGCRLGILYRLFNLHKIITMFFYYLDLGLFLLGLLVTNLRNLTYLLMRPLLYVTIFFIIMKIL